jgi:hypothetical protein
MTSYLPRSDTRQQASLRRRDETEEFMMRNNGQRLGEHATAALLGQVTPMSAEVAIVAGEGGASGHTQAATRHPANRAAFPAEVTMHAVAPEAVHHRDPVTTSYLPGGEPGPVAKRRTTARGRARDPKEIP